MDKKTDIKPCPFCGSLGVAVVGSFVRCGKCGASGPFGNTEAEAVQRWNDRIEAGAGTRGEETATGRPAQ